MSKFTCDQVEPMLSAYRDGELAPTERDGVEKHVSDCAACQHQLLELNAIVTALKSLPRFEPKVDYAANIEQLLAAPPATSKPIKKSMLWGGLGAAAAAAVIVLAVTKPSTNLSSVTASTNTGKVNIGQTNRKANEIEIADRPAENSRNAFDASSSVSQPSSTVEANHKKNGLMPDEHNKPIENNSKKNGKYNPRLEVASKPNLGSDNIPVDSSSVSRQAAMDAASRLGAGDAPLIASEPRTAGNLADSNVVAVYETDQKNVTEELGINTDEDGLYAIKL